MRPNDVRAIRSVAGRVRPRLAIVARAASRSRGTRASYAPSHLNRVTVAPRSEHEVVTLQRGVIEHAETHQRSLVPARRGQLFDAPQTVRNTCARQMFAGSNCLAEQATHVERRAADRAAGRVRKQFAKMRTRRVV